MTLMEDQQAPQSAEGEAKVITLCGSTKFEAEFAEVNQRLTMEGCVVISLGMFSLPDLPDYDWTADSSDLKGRLGGVHFQKIRMADEVYIVDPRGYVGESTRREIAYAESLGKPVRYLSRERLARTGDSPQESVRPGGHVSTTPRRPGHLCSSCVTAGRGGSPLPDPHAMRTYRLEPCAQHDVELRTPGVVDDRPTRVDLCR